MTHKVKLEDLEYFKSTESVLFSLHKGKSGDKRLYCTLYGTYKVWRNTELVVETEDCAKAVEIYNNIEA